VPKHTNNIWAILILAAPLFLLVGCREPIGRVSGMVLYKGAPVTNGSISFHLTNKGIAQNAKLDSAGRFAMSSPLPPGTYQVYYILPTVEPRDPFKNEPLTAAPTTMVPKRYHELSSSDLAFEVQVGENDILIELKD
jgi:hypothetical protein